VARVGGLDVLRGVAVILVVACHAGVPGLLVGGGTAGVTVFFVLSGFLITRILIGQEGLSRFYLRRAARLIPALLLMLIVVGFFYAFASLDFRSFALGSALTLSYVANWFPLADLGPLLHTWSLSVEEQFYLVWPLIILVTPRRRLPQVLLVAVIASLLVRGAVGHAHAIRGTDANSYALALGGLLAVIDLQRAPRLAGWVGWGLIGLAAAAPRDFDHGFLWGLDFRWSPPIAAAGAGLLVWTAVTRAQRAPRPLTHLADVSYGWYLWHLPLMLAVPLGLGGRLIAAAIALLCAEASLRWVERPILRRYRAEPRQVATGHATASVTVPITDIVADSTDAPSAAVAGA
jgi:peptidoglycan/LPS O-acetylase OafA/YrhL